MFQKITIGLIVIVSAFMIAGFMQITAVKSQNNSNANNTNISSNIVRQQSNTNIRASNVSRLSNTSTSGIINKFENNIACQYLTKADVEKIFGQPVNFTEPNINENESSCAYQTTDSDGSVQLSYKTFPTIKEVQNISLIQMKSAELMKLKFPNDSQLKLQLLPEIGELAFLKSTSDCLQILYFQKNNTLFAIAVQSPDCKEYSLDELTKTAQKIVANFQ